MNQKTMNFDDFLDKLHQVISLERDQAETASSHFLMEENKLLQARKNREISCDDYIEIKHLNWDLYIKNAHLRQDLTVAAVRALCDRYDRKEVKDAEKEDIP